MQHPQTLEARGPFKGAEGREFAGLIELVGVPLDLLPDSSGTIETFIRIGRSRSADFETVFCR
jgi:hypothetical protein